MTLEVSVRVFLVNDDLRENAAFVEMFFCITAVM